MQNDVNISDKVEQVDCLCIGTSIIMSLEAIHQARLGKKVLMVDRSQDFGGAWKTIEIFGIENIENAIHYFLPDQKGIDFLRNELNWPIEVSQHKYRYFNIFNKCYFKTSSSSLIGRFISNFLYSNRKPGLLNTALHFLKTCKKVFNEIGERSYYVSGGAAYMLKSINTQLSSLGVEIRLSSNITGIFFDIDNARVHCRTGKSCIITKSLILGHGARLPEIKSKNGILNLEEKFHQRPAYHLVVRDYKRNTVREIIFAADPIVKYVHDISRFSSLGENPLTNIKVFVFALQSHIADDVSLREILLKKLQDIGAIDLNAKIIESLYSDIILPTLNDEDLDFLKDTYGDLVSILRTENFSAGVGYYSEKWKSR